MPRTPMHGTAAWQKRRAVQLAREPLCRMCGKLGIVEPATVADHVEPHYGDPEKFWRGELQSLCEMHHNSMKQAEERRGYSTLVGVDGWPMDDKHPSNRKGEANQ